MCCSIFSFWVVFCWSLFVFFCWLLYCLSIYDFLLPIWYFETFVLYLRVMIWSQQIVPHVVVTSWILFRMFIILCHCKFFFISVDVNKQINLAIFLCPTLVRKFILIRWRIGTLRWECDLCCLFVHFPNILHGTVAHNLFYCFSMANLYTTGRTKWTDTSHRTIQIAVWHMLLFWIRFVEKISLKNVLRC